jgi:hypothetical protein
VRINRAMIHAIFANTEENVGILLDNLLTEHVV